MIALARAYLCLDEDALFDGSASGRCPSCGSAAIESIARWLNREETKPDDRYAYHVTAGNAALAEPRP